MDGWTIDITNTKFTCAQTGTYIIEFSASATSTGGSRHIAMRLVKDTLGNSTFNEIKGSQIYSDFQSTSSIFNITRYVITKVNNTDVIKVQVAGNHTSVKLTTGDINNISDEPTSVQISIHKNK